MGSDGHIIEDEFNNSKYAFLYVLKIQYGDIDKTPYCLDHPISIVISPSELIRRSDLCWFTSIVTLGRW